MSETENGTIAAITLRS